jgi:hypothetical protein
VTELFSYGAGVQNVCTQAASITGFLVTHCTINDAYIGICSDYGAGCSNYEFSYNTIYNCNWGGNAGDRSASATLTGLSVHHNRLYNWANWDEMNNNSFHHNGFYGWAESGGSLSNITVFDNTVGPNFGAHATSGVFFSGGVSNILIYNNLFLENANDGPANGLITATGNIFNNTFIGQGSGIAICGGGTVKNNLAVGVGTFIFCAYGVSLTADYNFGYNLKSSMEYCKSPNSSGVFYTFAQWRGLGYDTHGSNANPLLDTSYKLTATSPAINKGADLSAYFTIDKDGVTRPQDAGWDVGAYEYTPNALKKPQTEIGSPSSLPLLPNPLRAAYVRQLMASGHDVRLCNLAGQAVAAGSIQDNGVYLVGANPAQVMQKIVIIK